MQEIKKLNTEKIAKIFGLLNETEDFIFKPLAATAARNEYEPHRSQMYAVGFILKGESTIKIDLENYQLKAPAIITIGPELIKQWGECSSDFQTVSLFFSEDFIVSSLSDPHFLKNLTFYKKNENHLIQLDQNHFTLFNELIKQIENKINGNSKNKWTLIKALIKVLLLEIEDLHEYRNQTNPLTSNQSQNIVGRFKALLIQNFHEYREVRFYADKLFIHPKHLSQVLKEQTGRTAREMISEIVILESKVLLQNKVNTINQISDALHFANPSFFAQFFKRHTGKSPKEFRNSL